MRSLLERLGIRRRRSRRSPRYQRAVGGHWSDVGQMQRDFLLGEGLRPGHYFLDAACGSFRCGRFIIDYLEPGHYYGFDGDGELLAAGRDQVLRPQGLLEKKPNLFEIALGPERLDFGTLLGRQFDVIWAHALFDHIPPETIRASLEGLSEVLGPGGRLYATIFLNPHGPEFQEPIVRPRYGSLEGAVITFPDREYWHHTLDFFRDLVSEISGLELDACLYDYPHPLGLRVLRFVRT